jgi:hypothetical protein
MSRWYDVDMAKTERFVVTVFGESIPHRVGVADGRADAIRLLEERCPVPVGRMCRQGIVDFLEGHRHFVTLFADSWKSLGSIVPIEERAIHR